MATERCCATTEAGGEAGAAGIDAGDVDWRQARSRGNNAARTWELLVGDKFPGEVALPAMALATAPMPFISKAPGGTRDTDAEGGDGGGGERPPLGGGARCAALVGEVGEAAQPCSAARPSPGLLLAARDANACGGCCAGARLALAAACP